MQDRHFDVVWAAVHEAFVRGAVLGVPASVRRCGHPTPGTDHPTPGTKPLADRLGPVAGAFIANFLQFLFMALWALVFGRMIMSWVDPTGRNRVSSLLFQATEPILAPVRRMLPQSGMIDWSGFVVLLILGFLWRAF